MEQLSSIVYVSAATRPTDAAFLESLLTTARDLNVESGVTGVLLCSDDSFMQCFEGQPSAVELTWQRIRDSSSHTAIQQLMNEPVGRRSFPDWQMGLTRTSESELLTLSTARWNAMYELSSSGTALGFELLQQFWRNSRRVQTSARSLRDR